jgi:ADP-heptose:LPS heptosyltransferase
MDLRGQALLVGLKYGIGDVVMEFPILQRLRRVARGAHLTAVGAHPAIELLADHSLVDEVVGLEAWGITHRWDAGDDAVCASLREWFGARHFELCLDINQLPPVVGEVVRELGIPMRQADGAAERAAVRAGANAVEAI